METVLIDANVVIRFLLNDHPKLSPQAKSIFSGAQEGSRKVYLDEVVVAEVIWTLSSFYKIKRTDIADRLINLISQDWVINSRKNLILQSLDLFHSKNMDYIDCWLWVLGKFLKLNLQTFDKRLKKLD